MHANTLDKVDIEDLKDRIRFHAEVAWSTTEPAELEAQLVALAERAEWRGNAPRDFIQRVLKKYEWPTEEEDAESFELKSKASPKEREINPLPGKEKPRLQLSTAVMSNSIQGIVQRQTKTVRRHVEIVVSPCSLNTLRTVMLLLFHVHASKHKTFHVFRTNVADLSRSIELDYRMTKDKAEQLLDEMSVTRFRIHKEGRTFRIPATAISDIDDETGAIRLELNSKLEPYLLDLKRNYRTINDCAMKLHSPRSVMFYWYFRSFVGLRNPKHRATKEALYRVAQVDPSMPWRYFDRDVLGPVVEDIKRTTELRVTYKPERNGRTDRKRGKVDSVILNIKEKPDKSFAGRIKSKLAPKPQLKFKEQPNFKLLPEAQLEYD